MTPWPAPKLTNPQRLNVDLCRDDVNTLKSVIPNHGFLSVLTQTFFHDLAEYIRSNGITYLDYDLALTYIRHRADSQFAQHPYTRIDRGRPQELRVDSSRSADVKPSHAKATKSGLGVKTSRKAKG